MEVPDLEELNVRSFQARLASAFPSWDVSSDEGAPFQVVFYAHLISITTWSSTPDDFFDWLADTAIQEGLTLFDPQSETVERADVKRAKRIALEERRAEDRRRWEREIAALKAKAAGGDAEAQYELGNRYAFGEGIAANAVTAYQWYERSAQGGWPSGMFNLAACYHHGDGVTKDIVRAIEWYELAAGYDQMLAPFALGMIYMEEESVPHDLGKAAAYFETARDNGHPDAAAALKLLRSGVISEYDKQKVLKFWRQP